jgi:aspartyl-tRNA(Asn)/glutamyl-tRNA(Gln) amidotransferase subunit B
MERGQLRVEANVSLRRHGAAELGIRAEVKNMNSFRSVERAIDHEIERQAAALDAGEPVVQETRGWDEAHQRTYHMRFKEDSEDYRYFPEPDLPPLRVDPAWLDALRAVQPELPADRRARYIGLGLAPADARTLVAARDAADTFDAALAREPELAKPLANWVTGEVLRLRNAADGGGPVDAAELAALVRLVVDGTVSAANGKEVLAAHAATGRSIAAIIEERGLRQISDASALGPVLDEVIAANPTAIADYRAGKDQAVKFLVGQVMKATRGQANAAVVTDALRDRLDSGAGEG